jgi:hypothetical protein
MQLRVLFSFLFCAILFSGFSQVSVGIIGSATPGGWDTDTDMVQSPDSAHLWSIVLNLVQGEAKFRQDNAWDINWGATGYPTGIGTQGGPNIPIPAPGEFTVTFNSITGAYSFSVRSDIGIIGNATPGGWNDDTNMFQDQADTNHYFITLVLSAGEAKFRQNDAWTVNWGAVDFPSGIGTLNGPNIPIANPSKYLIDFNKSTGAYSFTEIAEYTAIGIIGSATPGLWDTDTDLTKVAGSPNLWRVNLVLNNGEAKFRANDAWTYNWGDTLFPIGIGIAGGGNIPVDSGEYQITFNTETFEYQFLLIGNYQTVGIIGSATPGGWGASTALDQDPADKSIWKKRLILIDGEAKFRADNDWTVNWGGAAFPTGIAEQDGANIPVPAGEYKITFNSTTGEYNFELLVIFGAVGIIGPATPIGTWDADVDMTKDAVDESFWSIASIDLTDGEAKFRAEDAWTVNWGIAQFPTGVGTQDGPNIPIVAGTYRVTLNSASGEYAFGEPSSTIDLLKSNSVSIAPNPAKDVLNIQITAAELKGDAHIILFDMQGRRVLEQNITLGNSTTINVSRLNAGSYLLHIANGKYMVGKNVVIVK